MISEGRAAAPAGPVPGMVAVRDAREHNLDHVDVDVPRDRIVAFTGVSGSGKSSLALATVYAEAQRRFLESVAPYARRGHTLYLLDEPTTGLHPADTELLLAQLHSLVDEGNTVVVVEHDMRVAADADWVVDLGPGGGSAGGAIGAAGPPAEVAGGASGKGRTAYYLARALGSRG